MRWERKEEVKKLKVRSGVRDPACQIREGDDEDDDGDYTTTQSQPPETGGLSQGERVGWTKGTLLPFPVPPAIHSRNSERDT